MGPIRRVLVSRWTLGFVGAALAALLVWFLGVLVVESPWLRGGLALAIVLAWLAANLLLAARRRRTDRALVDGVAAVSPGVAARADEAAQMREKLATAMGLLRRASGSRGYLYEQPWYVIIGPPGAGKTTALLNAGLTFPLAAEMGQGAVAGVGGTRMCDWWFTEHAVLIDTAGRYTVQDSDAQTDRAGWLGFLDLLRRTRPRQPLNGVLVAIGVTDLVQAAPPQRLAHARAIRRRIKELTERLGLRLPVYALFTKADLLAGFSEFFDDLDRVGRDQVWGHSFALAGTGDVSGPVAGWREALRGLVGRLDARLLDRLQTERSIERRSLLAGFPAQLASLETALADFLTEAFAGSRLDPAPNLRGVYFASGTQQGTPIDRLTGVLAQSFGVDQMRVPSLRPQQGRSYFLGGLLRLVFNEAMLGSSRPGAVRRRRAARLAAFATISVLTLALAAGLLLSWQAERREAAWISATLASYQGAVAQQARDPVQDPDLASLLPLLDQAAALSGAGRARPLLPGFGLQQAGTYREAGGVLYGNALTRLLLPRLVLRLERQMQTLLDAPDTPARQDALYQALQAYRMLCGLQRPERSQVRAWEEQDAQGTLPGEESAALMRHVDALLRLSPLPAIAPDAALLDKATRSLPSDIAAQQAYLRIRSSAAAQALPDWTAAGALGTADTQIFYRASGKPLTEGVPGFFTPDGFFSVLLPQLVSTPDRMRQADIIRHYTADFEAQWDAMLLDLKLRPLGRGEEAERRLFLLDSPLRNLLRSIAQQLDFDHPPARASAVPPGLPRVPAGVLALLNEAGAGATPGPTLAEHYASLRDWIGPGPSAQLDTTLTMLDALRRQVGAAASGGAPAATAEAGGDAVPLLLAEASHSPLPIDGWLRAIATGSSATQADSLREGARADFEAQGGAGPLCRTVTGFYPFRRHAGTDVAMHDFAHLFAPGGVFDSFFRSRLAPFVADPAARVWRLQPANGVPPPIGDADLAQFRTAQAIGRVFFADGGAVPSVHFAVMPDVLDAGARQATLNLGGIVIVAAHQPVAATQVTWPSPMGMDSAGLSFDPAPRAATGTITASGQWALFRLIDHGRLQRGARPGESMLSLRSGEHSVGFRLTADPDADPFTSSLLQEFRCPSMR
nr:type VI secretion system membrane subunit TssM [uncultured Lichenicoccus sp.]